MRSSQETFLSVHQDGLPRNFLANSWVWITAWGWSLWITVLASCTWVAAGLLPGWDNGRRLTIVQATWPLADPSPPLLTLALVRRRGGGGWLCSVQCTPLLQTTVSMDLKLLTTFLVGTANWRVHRTGNYSVQDSVLSMWFVQDGCPNMHRQIVYRRAS